MCDHVMPLTLSVISHKTTAAGFSPVCRGHSVFSCGLAVTATSRQKTLIRRGVLRVNVVREMLE